MDTTRRTIVLGFSSWKVSGFTTKPNTLLRVPEVAGGGALGKRALPLRGGGRGATTLPVTSGR